MTHGQVAAGLLLSLSLGACTSDKEDTDDTSTVDPLCEDAPVLTWDNFGSNFVTQNCQACHASGSANRNGAPESVTFDDKDLTLAQADRILERATNAGGMPPLGGTTEDDQYKVEVWLTCWE